MVINNKKIVIKFNYIFLSAKPTVTGTNYRVSTIKQIKSEGNNVAVGNINIYNIFYKKLRGRSPQANYTDRATAACRRS
jgi:hypothetical protein